MSKLKIIPGPWFVDHLGLNILAPSQANIGDVVKIADVRAWGYLTGHGSGALGLDPVEARAIQEANANLMAAAPDLLAACQRVIAAIHEGWSLHEDAEDAVLSAIEKATKDKQKDVR